MRGVSHIVENKFKMFPVLRGLESTLHSQM